jgi:hypothetical protein
MDELGTGYVSMDEKGGSPEHEPGLIPDERTNAQIERDSDSPDTTLNKFSLWEEDDVSAYAAEFFGTLLFQVNYLKSKIMLVNFTYTAFVTSCEPSWFVCVCNSCSEPEKETGLSMDWFLLFLSSVLPIFQVR